MNSDTEVTRTDGIVTTTVDSLPQILGQKLSKFHHQTN